MQIVIPPQVVTGTQSVLGCCVTAPVRERRRHGTDGERQAGTHCFGLEIDGDAAQQRIERQIDCGRAGRRVPGGEPGLAMIADPTPTR